MWVALCREGIRGCRHRDDKWTCDPCPSVASLLSARMFDASAWLTRKSIAATPFRKLSYTSTIFLCLNRSIVLFKTPSRCLWSASLSCQNSLGDRRMNGLEDLTNHTQVWESASNLEVTFCQALSIGMSGNWVFVCSARRHHVGAWKNKPCNVELQFGS